LNATTRQGAAAAAASVPLPPPCDGPIVVGSDAVGS
jgi:hypothetical protein